MPFATAPDGTRLYYEALGQGTPLVLISGQAFDHHMWDGVRDDFTERHLVIVFDQRGTGQSDKPEQAWTTRGFAQDVVCILDAMSLDAAHVYGFSMGGRIAQWLGIDHGPRVRSLVLGATTPGNAHGVRRSPQADAVLASGRPSALRDLLVPPAWQQAHPEWLAMMAERTRHPMPAHAQRQHYRASEGHEAWDDLPRIHAPTLLLHGSADDINPCANSALIASRLRAAQVHVFEGARHGYFWECREEARRVVNDFLQAQDRAVFQGI